MTPELAHLIEVGGYVVAGRLVIEWLKGGWREFAFAALNIGVLYRLFFHGADSRYAPTFLAYLALIVFQYAMLRVFGEKGGWKPWLAFFTPILALVFVRYVPPAFYSSSSLPYGPYFIGISYLAFRCSHLVLEVRNGAVKPPGFFEYLGFSFFVPTMSVGPINPYSNFRRGFDAEPPALPAARAFVRILVGMVKYKFLGSICFQLTYSNLLLDDHYHPWIDLPVAAIFYYLFLYCNFSGFCDMAIGCAGLIGIPVIENFNNPFAARNMREFWNRWHISLSQYMRDVCFSPLSKYFARLFGPANINHAIALTILVVFLLIGIWHGTGWNYVVFGLLNGVGVIVTHYYTVGLKKWLGREDFKAYNSNPWIRAVGVIITFCYFATTLFFFANTPREMKEIFSVMR
jgi:D-alanyl-lipoteichoic acid acyltransferase DltB (MBOAT superfamily)